MDPDQVKVVIVPGNGGAKPTDNWFPYIQRELEKVGVPVIACEFPDSFLARESVWIPFLEQDLQVDQHTILIGHSSGAIAALRFAEKHKILGSVLVGVYHTDLDNENEKLSGYFNRPWNWAEIKKNQKWVAIFASEDDPWIPIAEPRFVRDQLTADYYEYEDQGHFGGDYVKDTFPEIIEVIKSKIR